MPQNRERVYIKGYLRKRCGGEVLSVREESKEFNGGVNNSIDYFHKGKCQGHNILNECSISTNLTSGGGNCGSRTNVKLNIVNNKRERVYSIGGLSPTMGASHFLNEIKVCKPGDMFNVRRLTPLECERLQGFPDNWTQYGVGGEKISDTQRYKCIGNAVTTNVITYLINQFIFITGG